MLLIRRAMLSAGIIPRRSPGNDTSSQNSTRPADRKVTCEPWGTTAKPGDTRQIQGTTTARIASLYNAIRSGLPNDCYRRAFSLPVFPLASKGADSQAIGQLLFLGH